MPKVAIDMGHGGSDPGARGKGMQEKKINYNVGKKLKTLLENDGFEVIMTRKEDEFVGLSDRANIANSAGADIMVSIHHNAGGGDGFEIIYQIDAKVTVLSNRLAEAVGAEFEKQNNKRKIFFRRGTKNPNDDYHTVIAVAKMPAIITEFAFMDSADVNEVDTLTEQHDEAMAIFKGIKKYFGRA